MTRRSLRLRLVLAASGLIVLALALAGLGLVLIFDRVLDARTAEDLDRTVKFLAGQVSRAPDGSLRLNAELPDPRFGTPYGGLYWQIDAGEGTSGLASRSLWDRRLAPPGTDRREDVASASGGSGLATDARLLELAGPDGGRLIALRRRVAIGPNERPLALWIAAAMDRRELAQSRARYLALLIPSLVALGVVLALAMSLFVSRALAPFRALRSDLRAVHQGEARTLPERFPDEVQPLVDDLNRLIGVQERALARARTQAGDMAHGLKTPLAVLTALARRLRDAYPDIAGEVDEQARAMQAQVERALVRARVAVADPLHQRRCAVAPVVERLVGVLERLPDADSLTWEVAIPATLAYPGDAGALTELLGNLLDNARKWAHRRILVSASAASDTAVLWVEEDGPGMDEAATARIGRGRRWDESTPGTGFGLAIAADLAEETGAQLTLARSPLGGLRAALTWPS